LLEPPIGDYDVQILIGVEISQGQPNEGIRQRVEDPCSRPGIGQRVRGYVVPVDASPDVEGHELGLLIAVDVSHDQIMVESADAGVDGVALPETGHTR
jgi:hypothetical protein